MASFLRDRSQHCIRYYRQWRGLVSITGGSIFGYRLLWVFFLISLLKWVLAYTSMRHMVLSGGHPLARWTQLPGPQGWFPLTILVMVMLTIPLWFSLLSGVLGTICIWIFGMGSLTWTTVWVLLALILLAIGGYDFLEKAQTVILAITLVCVLIAVAYVRPDWLAVLKRFVPRTLEYPDWVFAELPSLRDRSEWVEVLVYAAAIGGQSMDYLAYLSFLRDKKWGRSHLTIACEAEMQATAERVDHPARLWVRAALIDTVVSFAMVVLIAGCFAIMGTVLLRPAQMVPAWSEPVELPGFVPDCAGSLAHASLQNCRLLRVLRYSLRGAGAGLSSCL